MQKRQGLAIVRMIRRKNSRNIINIKRTKKIESLAAALVLEKSSSKELSSFSMPKYSIFVGSFTCAVVATAAGAGVVDLAILVKGGAEDDVDSSGATKGPFAGTPADDNTVAAGLAKDSALVVS